MSVNLESLKEAFAMATQAVGLWKKAREMIPAGKERAEADKAIIEAETAIQLAEVKAAQALGYELCRCTWPPQICLRKDGRHNICPKCGYHAWLQAKDEGDESP